MESQFLVTPTGIHASVGPAGASETRLLRLEPGRIHLEKQSQLHHLIGDGSEPELAEACRVTARNGVLILLGLNRSGWRYRTQGSIRRLPGLAPLAVKDRLEQLGMRMQGFAGAGLLGQRKPRFMNDGLGSLGAPLADVVILQATHRDSMGVTPLRFRKPRAAVVQSAPMQG